MRRRLGSWRPALPGALLSLLLFSIPLAAIAESGMRRALDTLDGALDQLDRAPNVVALSACVSDGDELVFQQLHGQRALESSEPVDERTRFRIASLSKGFAATLAAMLEREDKLSLSEPVVDAVPWFALKDTGQRDAARLEHLLTHQIGLPPNAYDNLLEANWDPANIVKRFPAIDMICPVGDCYGYQNVGYNLIADAITRRTGRPFQELVEERLFEPLDMSDSGFGAEHLMSDDNWARPHIGRGRWLRGTQVKDSYYRVPAAAGINASTRDLCRWLMAQTEAFPQVLDGDLLATLHRPRVRTARELYRGKWRRNRLNDAEYGLGWRIYDYAGQKVIFHAGSVQGYGATIALLPDWGIGIATMWNSESIRTWGLVPTFLDAYFGLRPMDWMKLSELDGDPPTATGAGK
ncbi:MAG: beta-lactamase family protein [Xanthomonadales bacterium]|nr:beta-lactamase family protein [Xanthomonadales bacterium]